MNFNIYLEDELANDLIVIAKKSGKTRNSLVREAIHEYVNKQHHLQWSEKILNFNGVDDGIEFESYRDELLSPNDKGIFA
ncbi:CopG family transcriptional regulator [Cyanobacterium aponinum UTEX 3222]|uniref:Ribbon-helix-helix protein CopG domain-containing protein n=3 Tax=Cyanobacterium aponinum TaxID=379064 RepID=K9Z2Q4_CYAAP|nr:CopG family transcriptional regulator [Cyanobacterium aponinum]WRL40786.1 CopG family transcriptional regulator [Cyanobacterium aponinum UTEX 3222]AFZ52855.1 hypothetical protein Cyan10605_0720 [Cyanobacterium aponinum PCC 10605]MBD2392988.1 CopG family transcriptional regulator [Cyanobacterium aponinum FACHB-4101]MTF37839.1 ribbon-helix-helix protein, CopG family [Cyanobacterium aponinum 0216]PHV64408.1 CopG family transcriptional regulator [Cyanobacterium aponinum IPPAS B-1201]